MGLTISLPTGMTAKCIGLDVWMNRVLQRASKVEDSWDPDAIHDLRTALRRCRTMADALSEVNPVPGWRRLKKTSKELFRALGDLRDVQVERAWVKNLAVPAGAVRKHVLGVLGARERKCGVAAQQALADFDRKAWRKLAKKLEPEAHFFPLESVVFQRQALIQLNKAVALYQKAKKHPSSVAWHRARIGIKEFRYVVENFLPQRYEVWAEDMKKMQDLLGELHDLDVLRANVRREAAKLPPAEVRAWMESIDAERKKRLDEFRSMTSEKNAPWLVWRAGFHWNHVLKAASFPQPLPLRAQVRQAS
jgi:CHAD domain-containing protein